MFLIVRVPHRRLVVVGSCCRLQMRYQLPTRSVQLALFHTNTIHSVSSSNAWSSHVILIIRKRTLLVFLIMNHVFFLLVRRRSLERRVASILF